MNCTMKFVPFGVAALVTLAGCDKATVEPGIEVKIHAVSTVPAERCAVGVTVGTGGQSFCTAEGERIDLINGLVAPLPLRAIACPTATALLLDALGALIPAALAHGEHIEAPAGVVDVADPSGTEWNLGALPLTPGTYCGIELSLEHIPAATFTAEVPEPHTDIVLYTNPCHFPNPPPEPPAHNHHCYTVPVRGTASSVQLDFPEPATLDAASRSLHVEVAIDFATWFDGIDFATLETDAEQQAALLRNVVDSVSIEHASAGEQP